jgi:hypothetical protein
MVVLLAGKVAVIVTFVLLAIKINFSHVPARTAAEIRALTEPRLE